MGKFFKGCLTLIVAVVVIGVLIGIFASGGEEETDSGIKTEEQGTEKNDENKDEETKTFKVGDTVDLNGLEITIESAEYVSANEYSPAKKGKVLQMQLNVMNQKDDKLFLDSTEFNLYDSDGNLLEPYFGGDDLDISGDIHSGKKLQGKLTFDVPESDSYELIYNPTFSWTDEEVVWEIKP
ncbi:DUF4352 domain-containing protein [Virgibacillus halodenitrificans]|uniref:DUF4352 domain-containing protein n=1 Tax=Virgibacillus halodenitrificans TaxID=1482 RepID=UPI0024BF3E5B|nr:DUF4352 domain-containing protein [Virgibacillus halodenitrificans]WHX27951.1 DUF4352 domain-containing protein [Virgibacillus halodenitrificans]